MTKHKFLGLLLTAVFLVFSVFGCSALKDDPGLSVDAEGTLRMDRLKDLVSAVGAERLVLDLSCRRVSGGWTVAMNKWQTLTELRVTEATLDMLAELREDNQQMAARLEQAVKDNPDSAEAWYFLGRLYMGEGRAAEAAKAFEQVIRVAGREPELLGQWAQALYFSGSKQWSAQLQALPDEALRQDPNEVTSLGLLGIAAFEDQRFADAVGYWQRLLAQMPADDPSRSSIESGIAQAREQAQAAGQSLPEAVVNKSMAVIRVSVDLAPEVKAKVQPGDAVFVFARAASGPPMPLAVKRLTVADLPAQVELSDADAMMAQLKLSSFPEIQLVARISRSGVATQGEWVGRGQPIASSTRDAQTLLIDSPEQAQ